MEKIKPSTAIIIGFTVALLIVLIQKQKELSLTRATAISLIDQLDKSKSQTDSIIVLMVEHLKKDIECHEHNRSQ